MRIAEPKVRIHSPLAESRCEPDFRWRIPSMTVAPSVPFAGSITRMVARNLRRVSKLLVAAQPAQSFDPGRKISMENTMYAAIRQGKAKAGMAEELAQRIKEGAIPIISDVPGFRAYYVIYAPDDTVTAISIFNDYAGAEESNRRGLAWIEQNLAPLLTGPATAVAGPVIVHTLA